MNQRILIFLSLFFLLGCLDNSNQSGNLPEAEKHYNKISLTLSQAEHLAQLPLKCMQKEYPNKLGQVLGGNENLQSPKTLHPAFYGCFDWHSSVHGHWMLVELLKRFPDMNQAEEVKKKLLENISQENILEEVAYFHDKNNKSYERTYGWAWLLKLAESLQTWNDTDAEKMLKNLKPLTDLIRNKYMEFLPKLYYPIRVGEHTNTGFGISFAWDYANTTGDQELLNLINSRAKDWFLKDENCPITWEPSGYDFLSPCLEEADIMSRVLGENEFDNWLQKFLPQLYDPSFNLSTGQVSDRSDGKLVHLDGVNFSRAWVLYGLASKGFGQEENLIQIANEHVNFSIGNVVDGDYAGEHWLASFALYALICSDDI